MLASSLIVGCRHELVGGPQPPGGLAHLAVEREQLGQLRGLVARIGYLHVIARELLWAVTAVQSDHSSTRLAWSASGAPCTQAMV